eukprot:1161815-Pelagomonas_calceolata.AAC.9
MIVSAHRANAQRYSDAQEEVSFGPWPWKSQSVCAVHAQEQRSLSNIAPREGAKALWHLPFGRLYSCACMYVWVPWEKGCRAIRV